MPHDGVATSVPLSLTVGRFVQVEALLVSRAVAAQLLAVSPRKLDEWAAAGLIAKWKLAGVVRYSVEELQRFVHAAVNPKSPEFRCYLSDQAVTNERKRKSKRTAGDGRRPHATNPTLRNGVDAPTV